MLPKSLTSRVYLATSYSHLKVETVGEALNAVV